MILGGVVMVVAIVVAVAVAVAVAVTLAAAGGRWHLPVGAVVTVAAVGSVFVSRQFATLRV